MFPIGRLFVLMAILALGFGTVAAQDDDNNDNLFGDPAEADVAVTVYNEGTALIRDRRTFEMTTGLNTINFTDVASSIDATSVSFVSRTDPEGTFVLEQNYVYDLVDSAALLRRYIDQTITVTTSQDTVFTGTLLSARGDIILQSDDGQVTIIRSDEVRDIQFPALPDGLITRPTLRWLVLANQTGEQEVELTYLTGGITWSADYNILLSRDNRSLDLNGWVTMNNRSGAAFVDAQLKLIAGDVSRAPEPDMMRMDAVMLEEAMPAMSAPPEVAQRELFEYRLYEIGRTVTIGNNETKQIEFVSGANIPANTFYVYDGGMPFYGYHSPIRDRSYGQRGITTVQTHLEFTTDEENGLGADLPAGRVRVYQQDIDGAALLIGENRIGHTPKGEEISLFLGNAFDLVGERTQQDFEIISDRVTRETFEIRLRNRKDDETVEIRVPERLYRWSNWEILDASHDFTQKDSATIEFRVDVPPGEEVVIRYTVQYVFR